MSNLNLSHCEKCGERTESTIVIDGVLTCRECKLREAGDHFAFLLEEAPEMFLGPIKPKRIRK